MGIDKDQYKVDLINGGKLPLLGKEPELPQLLEEQVNRGFFEASTDFSKCDQVKTVFICVDTPIDENRIPQFGHLLNAVSKVGECIEAGTLVVVESTIAPGTMRNHILHILEEKSGLKAGENLFLAHCPERVMSGKLIHNLVNMERVIGGLDKRSTEMAIEWYSQIVRAELHPTDMTTAEIVKTAENTYRDIQIAFANEVGLICEKLGRDAFEVRELVNTCPGRSMHFPGAGVGGHCLPKDSWLLAFGGREAAPKLIPMARLINDSMPKHTAEMAIELIEKAGLNSKKNICIGIFGLSYLENSGDTRNTPAETVIETLKDRFKIIAHDPYVSKLGDVNIVKNAESALKKVDCAIFLTKHQEFLEISLERIAKLMKHKLLVDGRNIFDREEAERLGIQYAGVGKG